MTDVEKCNINVTVENGKSMKCKLKGLIKMMMEGSETVKLIKVLFVPQAVKNLLRVSSLVSNGSTMEATQDRTTI